MIGSWIIGSFMSDKRRLRIRNGRIMSRIFVMLLLLLVANVIVIVIVMLTRLLTLLLVG